MKCGRFERARLVATLLLAAACASDVEGSGTTTGADASASGATETGAPASSEAGTSSTTTSIDPDDGTTRADTSASSSSEGATDPYFDVGVLPDLPGGDDECAQSIDIVFVIDVSTTMGEFIGILSDEILAVDAAVAELELATEPHYGLAVFVDDAALLNDGNPYDDALALQADFDMWAAFTASNEQVNGGNSNGTWTENSLDALWLAASDFAWRPSAFTTRIVIHVTDDTFWDGPTIGNGVPILHSYEETVEALQDNTVRVFSFADAIGGACECDDVTPGWSAPYMGMTAIPEATDGGVYDINLILSSMISLTTSIDSAVETSYCDPYTPVG